MAEDFGDSTGSGLVNTAKQAAKEVVQAVVTKGAGIGGKGGGGISLSGEAKDMMAASKQLAGASAAPSREPANRTTRNTERMIAMPDNDFWIGQEQIPVDLSLLLTYSNDEDYWYDPGEYALRVYTVDTLNTNFARPCFALGERTSDPEMEDVSGAIENTLHELLNSGATPEDVYRIMGLVKESELSPETKEADSYLPIDLGYCIDGNIVSYEAVPEGVATVPENVDYPRYAEAMESHVPLPIATQIAKHDFSHRQADILMEAARNPRVSPETLETIADKTLSSGKMRGLLDIASVGKNPLDFRNMDEQTLKAAVSVLFHGGKDLPVTELDLAQLRSVDLALMDGASPAEAMRAAEKSTSAEPEEPDASLASEAHDAKAARTALDDQSGTKDAPTRSEQADTSL